MATSFTAPALVTRGDFGPETRKHPALAFMEELTHDFYDAREHTDEHEWFADDFSSTRADGGHERAGRREAFEHAHEFHMQRLAAHWHVPTELIVLDRESGWTVYCQVVMYADLAGQPPAGHEKKVVDADGKKWDVAVPQFYQFDLVKDDRAKHHGILVQHTKQIYDTAVIAAALRKRGIHAD